MIIRLRFIAPVLVAIACGAYFTRADRYVLNTFINPIVKKKDMTETKPPIHVKEFTLKNGLPVWYAVDTNLDVITVGLCFNFSGMSIEPQDKPGIAAFLTALLDEGAGPYDHLEFKKKLIEKNVKIKTKIDQDCIIVSVKTTSAHLNDAFHLLKTMLTEPRFDKQAHTRTAQELTAAYMQKLHSPHEIARIKMMQTLLGDTHPYARSIDDKLKAVPHITTQDIHQYFKKAITQGNVHIAAAGNIVETTLKELLEDTINALPNAPKQTAKPASDLKNAGQVIYGHMDVPQSNVLFAQPGISIHDPDFFAANVLIMALGGNNFESRLWQEIREKRGLAYGVSLGTFHYNMSYGILGATGTKQESVNDVIRLVREQWADVAQNGISEHELDLQKEFLCETYPLSFQKTSRIVGVLLNYQYLGIPHSFIANRNGHYQRVTCDDVKRVAKRLLKPDALTFFVLGKKGT